MTYLTHEHARRMIDAALAAAAAEGLRVSVAITDAGGHLLAFNRAETANLATIDIAIQKARTAVFFQAPTRYVTAAMQPGGAIYTAQHTSGGLSAIPGGIPVVDEDEAMIGAIGISGGSAEQDDAIAASAVACSSA
ncbi:GlcG/HbpS family heme-binding protein [Curtobacterium sp. ME26]|uniref:GlcG/HbpS family heme-binding protein n=1 Tax=Curtobacterium sp. ME26 TaxID=2744254 RepID=UPI0015F3827F|nr:heme-binding protein [Curtobacterium sp. ME26]